MIIHGKYFIEVVFFINFCYNNTSSLIKLAIRDYNSQWKFLLEYFFLKNNIQSKKC
jgi:hypothetical protein